MRTGMSNPRHVFILPTVQADFRCPTCAKVYLKANLPVQGTNGYFWCCNTKFKWDRK